MSLEDSGVFLQYNNYKHDDNWLQGGMHMLFTYLFKHSTTVTVITMATRHTTTITAPTVMPISLVQLQEHMAVSAVTELSISKETNHDHCVSSSNHM